MTAAVTSEPQQEAQLAGWKQPHASRTRVTAIRVRSTSSRCMSWRDRAGAVPPLSSSNDTLLGAPVSSSSMRDKPFRYLLYFHYVLYAIVIKHV